MKRIKDLEVIAKQQISICCESLCERAPVEEYINELEAKLLDTQKELKRMIELYTND
tara:strand:+ start:330 stop:500 length:171 start_codon:yes stop_codon:yes gene_type:complete